MIHNMGSWLVPPIAISVRNNNAKIILRGKVGIE